VVFVSVVGASRGKEHTRVASPRSSPGETNSAFSLREKPTVAHATAARLTSAAKIDAPGVVPTHAIREGERRKKLLPTERSKRRRSVSTNRRAAR